MFGSIHECELTSWCKWLVKFCRRRKRTSAFRVLELETHAIMRALHTRDPRQHTAPFPLPLYNTHLAPEPSYWITLEECSQTTTR